MVTLGALTAAGNALVLRALCGARPRAPAHYPLASLATADLLLALAVLPLAAARELFVFQLEWAWCACWNTLDVLCSTASILSLCALGLERHAGVTAPLRRGPRRARVLAALVWPAAALVALPSALVPSPYHELPGEAPRACTINTDVGYVFFSASCSFYVPAGVMLVLYARIIAALRAPLTLRAHRGSSADPAHAQSAKLSSPDSRKSALREFQTPIAGKKLPLDLFLSPQGGHLAPPTLLVRPAAPPTPAGLSGAQVLCRRARQRRATRTIVVLMAMFLLCWSPFFIMLPIDALCGCVGEATWSWCTWLGYANSALNPMVYAATSPAVRRALLASTSSSRDRSSTPLARHITPNARHLTAFVRPHTLLTRQSTLFTRQSTPLTRQSTLFTRQSTPLTRQSTLFTRQSTPLTRQSTPLTEQSTPLTGQSTPITRQSTPLKGQSTPNTPQSTPITRQSSPLTRQSTPITHQSTPLTGQSTPITRQSTPITRQSTPLIRQSTPLTLQSTPLALQSTPLSRQSMPLTGQSKPLALQSKPLSG